MPLSQQARTSLSVVAAIVVLPLLYFHRAVFSDEVFIARDILRVYYPLKKYWAERVSQLQFPEWYPYDGLGQPYAGMLISGAFHPANLLYLLLPLGMALKVITLLSYVAALGGTYVFARLWGLGRGAALLAGLTYALGGYMVGLSNNLLYLMAAATFPWALWGAERFLRQPSVSRAAAAALPLGLVLLSGDPQSFALCNGMLLVLVLLRPDRASALKVAPWAGLLIVLGAILSAVQLLPVLGILKEVHPSAPTFELATRFSFHPLRLLELPLGPLFLDPESGTAASTRMADELFRSGLGNFWVPSVHLGAPALLLLGGALWRWRRHPLTWKVTGLACLVLALALALHLPLYGWLYRWMPLWNSFRYPEKLLPYVLFPCALGAGVGLEAALREPALARRLSWVGFGLALVCGLLALGEWQVRFFSNGVIGALWKNADPEILEVLHSNFLQATLLTAGTFGLMGVLLLEVLRLSLRMWAVLTLQLAVLYLGNESTYQVTYTDVLEQPIGMADFILRRESDTSAGRPRVFGALKELIPRRAPRGLGVLDLTAIGLVSALEPNTSALWKLESARPYLPAYSRRYHEVFISADSLNVWLGRLSGLFHVRYFALGAREYAAAHGNPDVVLVEDRVMDAVLLGNPRALPRAYLATPICVKDEASALALIHSRSFQPGRQVALECAPDTPRVEAPPGAGEPGQVRFVHYAPESVELDVEARHPTVLVLNDAWYTGWSATLDGQPTPILPANVAVRGVLVPAGTHRVSFTYRAPGQRLGALISLGGLGLLGLAVLVERRRRRAGVPQTAS
ncbi:YfhO family protein [Archangium minus]|uniref:YfhO family protein n=1 Tax=Archangium minus TaxID=83450 RepID=A0ABY9X4Z8_9BACT|nr:YfhO family protein [Archangium minus]